MSTCIWYFLCLLYLIANKQSFTVDVSLPWLNKFNKSSHHYDGLQIVTLQFLFLYHNFRTVLHKLFFYPATLTLYVFQVVSICPFIFLICMFFMFVYLLYFYCVSLFWMQMWKEIQFNLNNVLSFMYLLQVTFEAVVGYNYTSDIALDDMFLHPDICATPIVIPTQGPPPTFRKLAAYHISSRNDDVSF